MSNSRKWTTDFNAVTEQLSAFVKARAGRSITKRREAVERAATMPNRLPLIRGGLLETHLARRAAMQGEGSK